jgi:hypothetical protein
MIYRSAHDAMSYMVACNSVVYPGIKVGGREGAYLLLATGAGASTVGVMPSCERMPCIHDTSRLNGARALGGASRGNGFTWSLSGHVHGFSHIDFCMSQISVWMQCYQQGTLAGYLQLV